MLLGEDTQAMLLEDLTRVSDESIKALVRFLRSRYGNRFATRREASTMLRDVSHARSILYASYRDDVIAWVACDQFHFERGKRK
jgi:hypothetical protein